jgi:gamma-glutamyltranspeptidase / glutathione hydrolase
MARNVVATSQPLAAQAGLRMLLAGGNAADAAVAAAVTLSVVEPNNNGIGSDAFALLWDGEQLHGLNASGRSPAAWTPEVYARFAAMPARGWETVTVPGAVSAWVALSRKFGRLPFARLFEPAIAYARDGYVVSPVVARSWANQAEALRNYPGFADTFLRDGRAPRAGETVVLADHARTLERIAQTKGEAFYRGELAEQISAFARESGGAMTFDDLAAHQPDWVAPISVEYRGVRLHEIPPNGQGLAALLALGILSYFPLGAMSPDSADAIHLQIEAMKLAFADARRYVADPASLDVDIADLLDPAYLATRAKLIDPARAQDPTFGVPGPGGTVLLTAADADGMMVSFIQSNYFGFGSGIVVPGTGVSLQNRGHGFTLQAGHPNQVGPRKRPYHTILPAFVTRDGKPLMAFGLMGGPMQPQGHVQMMTRISDANQNPQAAADAPRWRVVDGLKVAIEAGFPDDTIREFRSRGHELVDEPSHSESSGGAQLIYRLDDGAYVAGSDPRKDGQAVGF